jgi:anti-sigma regulatory factor (Ser/Thr protein kinase)
VSSSAPGCDPLELELLSDTALLPGVRATLREWSVARGWTPEQAGEIALAVDEALSNVIRHGYGCDRTQRIVLSVRSICDPAEGEGVEIRIRDFGRQVDPVQICGRDLADVRPGGLGVHIIRAMMSSVEYSRAQGGGMLLVMRKFKLHRVTQPGTRRP